jgi:hypothetical protein
MQSDSNNTSGDTAKQSGISSSQAVPASSLSVDSGALRWFSRITVAVPGMYLATKLPSLWENPAISSTKAGIASLFVVALLAPMALKGVASVVAAARSGNGKAE